MQWFSSPLEVAADLPGLFVSTSTSPFQTQISIELLIGQIIPASGGKIAFRIEEFQCVTLRFIAVLK